MIFKKLCTIFAFEGICKHGQWLCRVFICVIIENSIITSANLLSFQLKNKRNYNFVITFSLFIIILNNIIMETSVTQRIKELIKKKGETDTSFSKKIGISQSTLSCQMRSVKGIGIEVVIATLNTFHDISAEWLLRGKGEMLFDEDMPKFEGTENEEEENLKIEISKIRAEKEELLTANLTLKEELIKKTGYIEGQQDYISKLIIENNILSRKISEASKKDIV